MILEGHTEHYTETRMNPFFGVSHPLDYTARGGAREESDEAFAARMQMMRACGIQRILCDVPFPFAGEVGTVSETFTGFKTLIDKWHDAGFDVLGVTPYPAGFEDGWDESGGEPGSDAFYATYERACEFLARELAGGVGTWLIANQLNLDRFRRPLDEDGAIHFMLAGGAGVKRGSPSALVGVNMFGFDAGALRMYAKLYPNPRVEFDYVGSNGFFGTFDPGGPEQWHGKLAILRAITRKPVIVLECGYVSRGEVMVPQERAGPKTHHELKKLPHVWGSGHTPEEQARYLERVFWAFKNTPDLLGAFWFAWTDRPKCWNCGQSDCPAGTANGLIDLDGNPKPAYHAFARAARGEFDLAALYPEEPTLACDDTEALRTRLAAALGRIDSLQGELAYLERALDLSRKRVKKAERPIAFRALDWLRGSAEISHDDDDENGNAPVT